MAHPADFERVSFKGDAGIGVLNLTTQVTTEAGNMRCLSATRNRSEPLDEQTLVTISAGVLKLRR